ncbi:MAG: CRISPR-associated endoribonuclease Cas6 [Tunicatimonas sp.]
MRVRIVFILKNKGSHVPFHHQFLLAQLIKGILVKGGEQEFITSDVYNFSGLKGQTKISRTGLHFYSSRVTLVFSASSKDLIDYFLKHLFSFSQLEIGTMTLIPETVEVEQKPEVSDTVKYVCISPLVLVKPSFSDDRGKRFIAPQTDTFSDLLYESTMIRMEQSGQYTAAEVEQFYKFQLVPDKDYLLRIAERQKKFARIYPLYDQDVKYEIRGYTFPFTLYAAQKVQEFIFTNGLGAFTYKGFGMLDIAGADPGKSTRKYEFMQEEA